MAESPVYTTYYTAFTTLCETKSDWSRKLTHRTFLRKRKMCDRTQLLVRFDSYDVFFRRYNKVDQRASAVRNCENKMGLYNRRRFKCCLR